MTPEQQLLNNFARRLRQEPAFMAHLLRRYMDQERLDEQQLAMQLGLAAPALNRLALCYIPRSDPAHFSSDLMRIANTTGANAMELLWIVRKVAALQALQDMPAPQEEPNPDAAPIPITRPGLLAAARDREEDAADHETGDPPPLPPSEEG
jgi:hypothetical protein